MKLVAKLLKAIHAQESKKAAREKAKAVVETLRSMKLKEAAKKVEESIEETLTHCDSILVAAHNRLAFTEYKSRLSLAEQFDCSHGVLSHIRLTPIHNYNQTTQWTKRPAAKENSMM